MKIRKIDFSKEKNFECGDRKFHIDESLSFARYRELQKISLEFGFAATFEDIFKNLTKAIESYNKHDYFDMSITIYKIQEGIKTLDTKDDPALRICALFINEDGEDVVSYSESVIKSKIDCWGGELDISPFFYLAANLVPHWTHVFELHIRDGLKPEAENESQSQ
ncbi:MAG TPA: hypothetical protein DD713_09980 [Nitrospiraceae bacterium]|nr:hypothetical protein [Nitrospiraceae bacterium]